MKYLITDTSIIKISFIGSFLLCTFLGMANQAIAADDFVCPTVNTAVSCPAGQELEVSEGKCRDGLEPVSCIMAPPGGMIVPKVKYCCIKPVASDPVAEKCTPKASKVNECMVAKPDENFSYTCMPISNDQACKNLGGDGVIANNPMGTAYPGCGTDGCCISKICVEQDTAAPASSGSTPKTYKLTNPLGNVTDLRVIARSVINTFLGIVGALALLVFVYAGLSYLIAGGNDQMVTKAKSTMKYGVIGVALIMLSYVLTDSFVTLWTKDLPASQPAGSGVPAESPTQAEQEVSDLLSQQQAAGEASAAAQAQAGAETGGVQDPEAAAKVSAKSSKTDVCGSTPATQGYSCMLIKSADKPNYNCLSGYCQSNSASNYLCCKQK